MWNGEVSSSFSISDVPYYVQTVCHPEYDMIAARVSSQSHPGMKNSISLILQVDIVMMRVTGMQTINILLPLSVKTSSRLY